MNIVDLSKTIHDGDKSHFNVTITDYLTMDETAPRMELPAKGYATKVLIMCDHTSTHVDATSHFVKGGMDIDEMPLSMFCGDAIALNFSKDVRDNIELGLDRFKEYIGENDIDLRPNDIVLFNMGDSYAGISHDLSMHLCKLPVKLVGTDGGTIDCYFNKKKPGHVNLLNNDIPIIENLTNLESIADRRVTFFGLPIKMHKATGSPIRAVAVLTD